MSLFRDLLIATQIQPAQESFVFTINSGSDSTFIIPTCGSLGNINNHYNWDIDWGDGNYSQDSGTGDRINGSGISHTYSSSNTNYNITITPTNSSEVGWLRAFGFYNGISGSLSSSNRTKVISCNTNLTENMIRTGQTDSYVCAYMFDECNSFNMGPLFNLPQGLTVVGSNFCTSMFNGCSSSSFTMNSIFNLPQNLVTIGSSFCSRMFFGCSGSSFNMNSVFNLPQSITTSRSGFSQYMFFGCSGASFTMNSIFNLPSGLLNADYGFCSYMYQGCSGASFDIGTSFKLPQNITSYNTNFCMLMFSGSSITLASQFFGSLVFSQTNLDRTGFLLQTLQNCTGITEIIDSTNIPALSTSPTTTNQCFEGCINADLTNCPINWQ